MTYSRSTSRRAPSSLPQRGRSKTGQRKHPVSQPVNMHQSYVRRQVHASDPPLRSSFNCGPVEGTQYSFPSELSTHPSYHDPNYASNPNSKSTSELESARALSFQTLLTPSSSNQGELQEFFGDDQLRGRLSPSDPEGALQGIGSSSHETVPYGTDGTFGPNPPHDNTYSSSFRHPDESLDWAPRISAEIPPAASHYHEPWSQLQPHYNGPSYPSDVVQESRVLQQYAPYSFVPPHAVEARFPPPRQQGSFQNNIYQGSANNQQHWHQLAASQGSIYPESGTVYGSSPASSSSTNTDTLPSATTLASRKPGRRNGPLSEEARENARFMRKIGCCYRCFTMREKCILDEQSAKDKICVRCRTALSNSRTWGLPCSQEGLEKRDRFVVPGFMANQLQDSQVDLFIRAHVESVIPNSSISVPLTIGLGKNLILENAVQVVLKDRRANIMHAVGPANGAPTPLVELNSPPIMPCLTDPRALQRHFNNWLDTVIQEASSELPEHYFPEDHEHWQRAVLTIICQYYQQTGHKHETTGSGPYQLLRNALKLTLLNHLMCHAFLVPKEEVDRLNAQLQGSYPYDAKKLVCPRLANKIIKSMLLPMLNRLAMFVLSDLHHLLRQRGNEMDLWDPLFCTVFLCLIVVGKFQVSFLERVEVGRMNCDHSFLEDNAIAGIVEMEKELSIHLVGQFHARVGTNRKANGHGKKFNPLARDRTAEVSWLAKEVSSATKTYGAHIFDTKELPHHKLGAMKEKNVTRLLASLMEPFTERHVQWHGLSA